MQKNNPSPPFNHAVHNFKTCLALKKLNDYDDWVITTAFYASMKFLEDALFPNTYNHPIKYGEQKEYKTFSSYTRDFGRALGLNKHKIISNLVETYIDDIGIVNYYEDLKQSCHTARYINYQVGKDRVTMAVKAIESIKNYCVSL